jgi:hypothetical protein
MQKETVKHTLTISLLPVSFFVNAYEVSCRAGSEESPPDLSDTPLSRCMSGTFGSPVLSGPFAGKNSFGNSFVKV